MPLHIILEVSCNLFQFDGNIGYHRLIKCVSILSEFCHHMLAQLSGTLWPCVNLAHRSFMAMLLRSVQ